MKIIIMTKEFPKGGADVTISDGSSYYFYNLCRGLGESRIEIVILCKGNHERSKVERQGRITVRRIDSRRYFQESFCLFRHLRERNTIVLTDGPAYTFVFGLFAKLLRLRHLAVFHDCRIKYYLSRVFAGNFHFGDFLGIVLTYASVLVNPDAVITVSEASKEELIKAGFKSGKIFVTYNGITLDHAPMCEKQDLIAHIGLAPWKNLSLVIEAMPYVLTRVPTAQLYVIGDGDVESYEEEVRKLGLVDKVRFCGRIPESEKHDVLRRSKVLTLVSSLEGFGIPILEAWKNDVAPVLSRLPVFNEIAVDGKNCIMTDFGPEQIADSIVLLLQNEELRMRLCIDGKKVILERFSLENVCKRFRDVIDSLGVSVNA